MDLTQPVQVYFKLIPNAVHVRCLSELVLAMVLKLVLAVVLK